MKKIVVIGGGTGTSVVLSGLKQYKVDITAVISMADDGGSTGRLRDEFGFQPVGDLRQSLAALAHEDTQEWVRKLLLYRFSHGKGLQGHNLGNLMLTALQDMTGSTSKSLDVLSTIFNLKGRVFPSTTDTVCLVTEYEDGRKVVGQDKLNPGGISGIGIKNLYLKPEARIYEKTENALRSADMIVINPGDLYGSIVPNLLVKGLPEAIQKSKAILVYVINLMTRHTQTHGYTASDHVNVVKKYCGKKPDIVIVNDQEIPQEILDYYEREHEYPVINDLPKNEYKIISKPLLRMVYDQNKYDAIKRSLLRHDGEGLAKILISIIDD